MDLLITVIRCVKWLIDPSHVDIAPPDYTNIPMPDPSEDPAWPSW